MGVSQDIRTKIEQLPEGVIFDYNTLLEGRSKFWATSKALERLVKEKSINRYATGFFYKPKQTIFGALKPSEEEILKTYLFKNGKRIGYITGLALYNRLGLTTQVPATIEIACKNKRIYIRAGNKKRISALSYVEVNDNNYSFLGLLDILKNFNKIPDMDASSGITLLSNSFRNMSNKELDKMIRLSLKYPPRARALLGAILEYYITGTNVESLKNSLNPISLYRYNIPRSVLPNAKGWNIKLSANEPT